MCVNAPRARKKKLCLYLKVVTKIAKVNIIERICID